MEMNASRKPAKPAPEEKHPVSEKELVYQQYIKARKACNLPVNNITPDVINKIIDQQKPGIAKKYNCDKIEYKVVIEEGVPKIKVRPQK